MKKYKWTIVGLILTIILWGASVIYDLDYFEAFYAWIANYDSIELDELVFPTFIILIFIIIDLIIYNRSRKVKTEKEAVYKAMVQATDHVLKNCLNQMLLVRYAAEETPGFDPEALKTFDEAVEKTTEQLSALGRIENVNRKAIGESIDIKIYHKD